MSQWGAPNKLSLALTTVCHVTSHHGSKAKCVSKTLCQILPSIDWFFTFCQVLGEQEKGVAERIRALEREGPRSRPDPKHLAKLEQIISKNQEGTTMMAALSMVAFGSMLITNANVDYVCI